MSVPSLLRPAIVMTAVAILASCGADERERPASSPRATEEGARAPEREPTDESTVEIQSADPRLVLFDVKTALESARPTQGGYPVPDEFRYEDRWRVHRERLDAAFDGWDYQSDGDSFRLRGFIGENAYHVRGP